MQKFKEFRVNELFDTIKRGKRIKSLDRISGKLPFITAGVSERGFSSYIGNPEVEIFPKGSLTVDMFGTVFYRNYEYGADDHVAVLYNNSNKYCKEVLLFIGACIEKSIAGKFSYSKNFYASDAHDVVVSLPIIENETPDFSYMKSFIYQVETKYISKLKNHLIATNLIDCEPSEEDMKVLAHKPRWEKFCLSDIFKWQKQKEINPLHLDNLKISNKKLYPFYGQATLNNGIITYCELWNDVLNNANGKPTILIHSNNQNTVYLETPFYLKDGHGATSVLQADFLNKLNALYIITTIKKVISKRFSYNAKATKIGLKNTVIQLPVTSEGVLDFSYMESYIKVQQKLAITNVIQKIQAEDNI